MMIVLLMKLQFTYLMFYPQKGARNGTLRCLVLAMVLLVFNLYQDKGKPFVKL